MFPKYIVHKIINIPISMNDMTKLIENLLMTKSFQLKLLIANNNKIYPRPRVKLLNHIWKLSLILEIKPFA